MTFSILTFGCRLNQAESAAYTKELLVLGFKKENNYKTADLVMVNSCCVTQKAEREVRQQLRRIKRENPLLPGGFPANPFPLFFLRAEYPSLSEKSTSKSASRVLILSPWFMTPPTPDIIRNETFINANPMPIKKRSK